MFFYKCFCVVVFICGTWWRFYRPYYAVLQQGGEASVQSTSLDEPSTSSSSNQHQQQQEVRDRNQQPMLLLAQSALWTVRVEEPAGAPWAVVALQAASSSHRFLSLVSPLLQCSRRADLLASIKARSYGQVVEVSVSEKPLYSFTSVHGCVCGFSTFVCGLLLLLHCAAVGWTSVR